MFTPTEEQEAIIKAAKETKDSLLLNALAGAAKTSTLELISKALPGSPILCLAFNKRIAEEMTARLPGHVKCQTLNSLGHRVWAQAVSPRKLVLNTKKSYDLLSEKISGLPRLQKQEAFDFFSEILRTIGKAKTNGYVPQGVTFSDNRLIDTEEFWEGVFEEDEVPDFARDLVDQCLTDSIQLAYDGVIDFDDQIYMPTLFGGSFPRFPLVMVDEAQDLSPLNHAMLRKLVTSRLIAVGDPWQSIYGFRGAVSNGMKMLRETFSMTELPLSISFRCPKEIVRRAHSRVPHMQWPEWAEEGRVNDLTEWTLADIPDGAAIICRNNAPLFSLAFTLIRNGRGIELRGSDIGPSLVKTLKKLGDERTCDAENALKAIDRWQAERLLKAKGKGGSIRDKAECLRIFINVGGSLAGGIAYAESVFKAKGPIQLLSGHKAKGLEWDNVFHLDPWRIPSRYAPESGEGLEQELNVRYVIETRAKKSLTLISLDGLN